MQSSDDGSPQSVDHYDDFEVIDLTHEAPQDLIRCEDPAETLTQRRTTAKALLAWSQR